REIVVIDKSGISNFSALQSWRSEADGELLFYIFDLIWYEGRDLRNLPLHERKIILESVLPKHNSIIKLSNYFKSSGKEFFETAKQMGLEGIIAKNSESSYQPGERTKSWLKIKANKRQEVV